MFVELHMLQNFAPSNLNRDDTGAPKTCTFGGYSRARISSQSQKRTIREYVRDNGLLTEENLAQRSLRLVDEVTRRLAARDKDETVARAAVIAAMKAVGFEIQTDSAHLNQSQYLLFLGNDEIQRLEEAVLAYFDELTKDAEPAAEGGRGRGRGVRKGAEGVSAELAAALNDVLRTGGTAADLAMYGRMLANLPQKNIDAASQVAHAFSTHRVSPEFDYFTAVDDLKPKDEDAGAGMIGTVEFNSACYYRYSNIDIGQLQRNLGDDAELARRALAAFLTASILALPDAKQNSFAALNPPGFVFAVVRDRRQPCSLANAFEQPIRENPNTTLTGQSVAALATAFAAYEQMFAEHTGIVARYACAPAYSDPLRTLGESDIKVDSIAELVRRTVAAAFAEGAPA